MNSFEGYSLYWGRVAVFVPHHNSIWIDLKLIEENNLTKDMVLEEEFFHLYCAAATPSCLYPLYNAFSTMITGSRSSELPDVVAFREIIEPLYKANQMLSGNYHSKNAISERGWRYLEIAKEIISLTDELAEKNSKTSYEKAFAEGFWGIMLFLLHIVPRNDSTGLEILRTVQNNLTIKSWDARYDLFFNLHSANLSVNKQPNGPFRLILPREYHTFVEDLFLFLRRVFQVYITNQSYQSEISEHLLRFVPSLLGIFSLGTFLVAPVISLPSKDDEPINIDTLHSNENSEVLMKAILENMNTLSSNTQSIYKECWAIRLFKDIVDNTRDSRLATNSEGMFNFMRYLITYVKDVVGRQEVNLTPCEMCAHICNPQISPYLEPLQKCLNSFGSSLVELFQRYREWIKKIETLSMLSKDLEMPFSSKYQEVISVDNYF